jgi:hypothetical protein
MMMMRRSKKRRIAHGDVQDGVHEEEHEAALSLHPQWYFG